MKSVVIFSVFALFGCQPQNSSLIEPSLSELNIELLVNHNGKKTKLSEINTNSEYTLNLSDEILFSGLDPLINKKDKTSESKKISDSLKESLQKKNSSAEDSKPQTVDAKNLKKTPARMEAFTSCLMKKKKYTSGKQLVNYQSHFYIIDLLPEEILRKHQNKDSVSCSFLFIIRDKKENEYLYNLPLLPVLSVGGNVSLKLLNDKNEEAFGQIINKDNMNRYDLILQQNKVATKIKFLCEEEITIAPFELKSDQTLVSPFKLLQSLKKEQLPSGKKRCRILTYGKPHAANGVTAPFYIDFETLKTPDFKTISLSNMKPELFVKNLSGKKTKLSEINATQDFGLNLSDEIVFSGLDAFIGLKNTLQSKSPIMETSSSCLMNNRKYAAEKQLTNYQPLFHVVDLLPEEILLEYKKSTSVSCSFLFIMRDTEENEHSYALAPLPILSIENNVGLKLLDDTNKEVAGQSIKEDTMSGFSLIPLHNKPVKKLKFLCEKELKEIVFELDQNETFIFPFQLLKSLPEKQLPSGKKKCRILTYGKNNLTNGATASFQIDFKDLKEKETVWMPKPQSLQIEIDFIPNKDISQYDRRKRKGKGRKNIIHTVSVFKIPKLFEQLPGNFKEKDYESYKIKVDTECFSPLFSTDRNRQMRGEVMKTYQLPLLESFPVMSVTPWEAFQIYLPENLTDILLDTDLQSLRSDGKNPLSMERRKQIVDYQEQVICSYHFQIQNERGELSSIAWLKNREIYWNPGSYGITFNTEKAEKGSPLLLNQALNDSIQIESLFLSNLSSSTFQFLPKDFALPDSMVFSCGGRRFHPNDSNPNFKTHYEKNFALNEVPLSIPLSLFTSKKGFDTYLKNNQFIKCRIVLYRKGVLQYFSQDLKFIRVNKAFLQELNNLSKTDTFWNFDTLSLLLYWL